MKGISFKKLDGSGLKIGVAVSRWNSDITGALLEQCRQALVDSGVEEIVVQYVPGSFELPLGAEYLIDEKGVDAVVALGCVIKGETMHFECIVHSVAQSLNYLSIQKKTPVIFGVLACLNEKQAEERATGSKKHAYNWGLSAVEMGLICKKY